MALNARGKAVLVVKRFSTAERFWKETLELVVDGNGDVMLGAPSELFDIMELNNELSEIPVWKKKELESDLREISSFWGDEKDLSASDVLISALSSTLITQKAVDSICGILARCSMVTPTGGIRVRRDDAGMSHAEDHFADADPEKEREKSAADEGMNYVKPSEIYEYLSGCIVSQDAAKRCASMIMYDHFSGRRSVCVFAGPTGSGKTEIFRLLQKKYPEDVRIVDASRLTAEGYRGSFHLRDIFEGISPARIAEKGIVVVLDEADKLFCETHIGSAGTDYSAMIQGQLLRMMDGDRLEFSSDMVSKEDLALDCSKVSVVLLGAFEKLLSVRSAGKGQSLGFTGTGRRGTEDYSTVELSHSDLIKAGMRTEIAGRIERIVQLMPLSGKDMEDILKKSVIPSFERELGIHISLAGESAGFLARRAVENSLGVRYLRSAVKNALDELIFEDPGRSECVIDLCA